MSKRTKQQCRGPAVLGSATQKCRMHGGKALVGVANPAFRTGRFSKYIPANLLEAYEESAENPEIIDLTHHMALLESRIAEILRVLKEDEVVPRWQVIKELWADFQTAVLSDDTEKRNEALANFNEVIESGVMFDRSWDRIEGTVEQFRKLADTEIKRKKELNLMVPIERVMVLMQALATTVKRHVHDPVALQAIFTDMERLQSGSTTADNNSIDRVDNGLGTGPAGVSGGRSREAMRRLKAREEDEEIDALIEVEGDE